MIKPVRFVPDADIEKRAMKMLAGFENKYGKIDRPPVPIDEIIERHLDLRIDWDEIADSEEERILGCLDPSEKKVYLNIRHRDHFEDYVGTEAYTKAHELGHWELHVFQNGETQLELPFFAEAPKYLCRQGNKDSREFQAERYAAFLLMPHHLVLSQIEGLDLTRWPTLYELKDRFGVTITALKNRFVGMKLIFVSSDKKIFRSEEEYLGNRSFF